MTTRFSFRFDPRYRLAALPFAITPRTAYVEVGPVELRVRFGPWRLRTVLTNVSGAELSEGFAFLMTAGPPHLSLRDRGVTFATNGEKAVCLRFREPVRGIDPTGIIQHPGATLTVADPSGLAKAVGISL